MSVTESVSFRSDIRVINAVIKTLKLCSEWDISKWTRMFGVVGLAIGHLYDAAVDLNNNPIMPSFSSFTRFFCGFRNEKKLANGTFRPKKLIAKKKNFMKRPDPKVSHDHLRWPLRSLRNKLVSFNYSVYLWPVGDSTLENSVFGATLKIECFE